MYDDLIKTFTSAGHVVPPQRAYDFSFAHQAGRPLKEQGWKS